MTAKPKCYQLYGAESYLIGKKVSLVYQLSLSLCRDPKKFSGFSPYSPHCAYSPYLTVHNLTNVFVYNMVCLTLRLRDE